MKNAVFARRDQPPGDLVIFYDKAGKSIGSEPYAQWMGPRMKPGETVQCACTEEGIHLDCPIHAVRLGDDSDPI